MTNTRKSAPKSFASICLYGTSRVGFHTLADTSDGRMFGLCPEQGGRVHESATEALWLAARELLDAGLAHTTPVAIHIDDAYGMPRVAKATLGSIPSFGSLKWEA